MKSALIIFMLIASITSITIGLLMYFRPKYIIFRVNHDDKFSSIRGVYDRN